MFQLEVENKKTIGWWTKGKASPQKGLEALKQAILRTSNYLSIFKYEDNYAISHDGACHFNSSVNGINNSYQNDINGINNSCQNDININFQKDKPESYPLLAQCLPCPPESLGSRSFLSSYGLKFPYVAGAMARGITSIDMVEKISLAGMLGFFGSAGLSISQVEESIITLKRKLDNNPFGLNLIYSPGDPQLESALVDLYLQHNINLISASAYLDITLPLAYFRIKGIYEDETGNIVCPNRIIAKVSRVEVARKFFSPPSQKLIDLLLKSQKINAKEATLAQHITMADDITAEADSGGHTDNRPALTMFPTFIAMRDEIQKSFNNKRPLHIGLGGGISSPASTLAAFAMGASYVVTGSVNQSCVEAGTSGLVKQMLSDASQADVTMAPSADMFEMGVNVQVLKRGTMFPINAGKLYRLYKQYNCYEEIPSKQREFIENNLFHCSVEEEWEQTAKYFMQNNPKQIQRAQTDPKHKMALLFRAYLGKASHWAIAGDLSRKVDFQIWCGSSMGAFNEWVKDSFLDPPENRDVVTVAMNLLYGASVLNRIKQLTNQGFLLDFKLHPKRVEEIMELIK